MGLVGWRLQTYPLLDPIRVRGRSLEKVPEFGTKNTKGKVEALVALVEKEKAPDGDWGSAISRQPPKRPLHLR